MVHWLITPSAAPFEMNLSSVSIKLLTVLPVSINILILFEYVLGFWLLTADDTFKTVNTLMLIFFSLILQVELLDRCAVQEKLWSIYVWDCWEKHILQDFNNQIEFNWITQKD